jgi:uncharacterized protein (TIGR02996 family)
VSDEAGLLAAIRDNLADDTPRLVYADWLQEHGQDDRAEFIRVDCERWETPNRRRGEKLDRRADQLLKKHEKAWLGPLSRRGAAENYETRRGFVVLVELSAAQFAKHAGAIFDHHPMIEEVFLTAGGPWKACFSRPEWKWVRALAFEDDILTPAALGRLVESPHATGLRDLGFNFNRIGTAGALVVSEWPRLRDLEALSFLCSDIRDRGAEAVLDALHGSRLRSLNLAECGVGDLTAYHLRTTELPELTELQLFYNDLTAAGAKDVAQSKIAATLTELNLHSNPIGDAGADALVASSGLNKLQSLSLMSCGIEPAAAKRLRKRFGRGVVKLVV